MSSKFDTQTGQFYHGSGIRSFVHPDIFTTSSNNAFDCKLGSFGSGNQKNIKISYGRPDSIVGGLQIKSVLWADSLHSTMYRYEGSFYLADIILMYNGNPVKGHYSPVGHCGKGLVFESNSKHRLRRAPG